MTASKAIMEELFKCQEDLATSITKANTNFKKSPKSRITQAYVETRLESLESYWSDFKNNHSVIIKSVDIERRLSLDYFKNGYYTACEEYYTEYKSELKEVLQTLTKSNVSTVEASTKNETEVKLPTIKLPTFSGNYTEWLTFHDMFVALIDKNKSLKNVQKLHYLKSNLTGEAEQLLRHIATTESNYQVAWEQLKKRYNNKRYIANSIFKRLMNIKSLSTESAQSLKTLHDTTIDCLNALNNLGISTDQWDPIIIYITVTKLDQESRKDWEQFVSNEESDDMPTMEKLKEFLETRFHTLEMLDPASKVSQATKQKSFHVTVGGNSECALCKSTHLLFQCKQFAQKSVEDRQQFVKANRLCFNCLAPSHSVFKCRQATSCRKCGKRHHTLIHMDRQGPSSTRHCTTTNIAQQGNESDTKKESISNESNEKILAHFSKETETNGTDILLATALVKTISKKGHPQIIRALLDQGSQASFITEGTVQLLGLKKVSAPGSVSGLGDGDSSLTTQHMVELDIKSLHDQKFHIRVKAYVLKSVTAFLPRKKITIRDWPALEKIQPLADPNYGSPNRIDILLGAEAYSKILLNGIIKGPQGISMAQNTSLGWILSGKIENGVVKCFTTLTASANENDLLKRFWELENEPNINHHILTSEEQQCEEKYKSTTTRDGEGRYIVKLPFRTEDPKCQYGESREIALNRFYQLERKLSKNANLKEEYTKVIQEYESLNHMVPITKDELKMPTAVYLPHHAVVREDKVTTKVRVVFDASCKGKNNVSLNDDLLIGPKQQQDLRHILMRWRTHPICYIADIVKMYRQVKVADTDSHFQRIVWRDSPNENIKDFRLTTVTFGTASAPYLAVRTLLQLAQDEKANYPKAASITETDFYMDDLMSGCETEDEAIEIYQQMNKLMNSGGFQLQKWNSNSQALLNHIGKDRISNNQSSTIKFDDFIKVLGLQWNTKSDEIHYTINLSETSQPITKRNVLSEVSKLFDPMGWLAPIIIIAKVFIQKLWLSGVSWDSELPSPLKMDWLSYRQDLSNIERIKIPRWIHMKASYKLELHGFSDASTVAYAAVVYVRVIDTSGNVHVTLLTAKTKVAPIKQISIPRLELCGATLLAKLLIEVSTIMKVPKQDIHAWCDSSVVLAWLRGHPSKWKTFVANRVSEILQVLNSEQWNYVKSSENPADCASRGVTPTDLHNNELWWNGPKWLQNEHVEKQINNCSTTLEEKGVKTFLTREKDTCSAILTNYSVLRKLVRIVAYCKRFPNCLHHKSLPPYLTANELREALLTCIRISQKNHFEEEFQDLIKNKQVKKRSNIYSLLPFIDKNGDLRVGGRLQHSHLDMDAKHPLIISSNCNLAKLLVAESHINTLHGGVQQMLTYLRSKYWIIRAKVLVKKYIHNCVKCVRHSAAVHTPLMGQLPEARVTPSRAFRQSGVDFAGPIAMRMSKGRGTKSYKGYICLFVCMATRAVHLEAVTDLTSQGFIAAFRRFVSRRGHCTDLYSDNATNFVGANKELKQSIFNAKSEVSKQIAEYLEGEKTRWNFIPPNSPNFGGLWEAGIKSVKNHLKKVIGNSTLTYEEMATLLCQIEACLNSRPISKISDDPQDPLPLTPGHFLVGEPLIVVPDKNYEEVKVNRLSRWQFIQRMTQTFWRRWSTEYLTMLNQKYKWNKIIPEPSVGDVVLVKEDNLPPSKWLLARIEEKHPGPDHICRVVTLKCKGTLFKRPVSKLCVLPTESI